MCLSKAVLLRVAVFVFSIWLSWTPSAMSFSHACSVPMCSFSSEKKSQLTRHVKNCHKSASTVFCTVTGCEFNTSYNRMKRHMDEHHPSAETSRALQCSQCVKSFATQRELKRHTARVHEKRFATYERVRVYNCEYDGCEKSFPTPGLLRDHETAHTGLPFLHILSRIYC